MYTACVLAATGNPKIPQAGFSDFRVFLPKNQKRTVIRSKLFDLAKSFDSCRIYPESLASEASKLVMLFRPSMMKDLEEARCLLDSQMIYSLWSGYLKVERQKPFLDWLSQHHISITQCHTSGHASVTELKRLAAAINARIVVPVHTAQPARYGEFFDGVELKQDGQWWEV
jgi:ribonuclease J